MLQRVAALTGKTFRFGIGIVPGQAGRGVLNERSAGHESLHHRDDRARVGRKYCFRHRESGDAAQAARVPSGGEYANDTGQKSLTVEQSLRAGAASEDTHTGLKLVDPYNARLLKLQGAGPLPTVQGPNSKIEPPVTKATRMPKQ